MQARDLFDWPESLRPFQHYFPMEAAPWEWLQLIGPALAKVLPGEVERMRNWSMGVHITGDVFLHPTVKLPSLCTIQGPAWIGPEVEIRPGVYIRGNVIVGAGSVLGNSCEYKNCLLMEKVETPHFNYVGDSILGNRSHLGAGVICANLRLARDEVVIKLNGQRIRTGLRKVGAFLGDGAEAGCNSVLQPGTILGRRAAVISMPFTGYLKADTIALPDMRYRTLPR
jgi:UDP-N-acetylglucosamine diphosphorylase / glucose-1-phosphate thymidylyltransferase / UDP-N-acetylgalactosamine diphosphorylase / glucosamine-1-phosphate N-acetyltransferase / galactosamine-1-phosphate N-acetyltransferase